MPLILAPYGEVIYHCHQQQRHDDRRHHAAHEQLAHADARHAAVDDQRDGGREDRADDRGGRRYRSGKVFVITVRLHGFHLDGAETARIRHGRAGHAGENHRCNNIGMAQTAGDPAHQFAGRVEDFLCDAAGVHEVAGKNKQRYRDQKEGVDSADHLLSDDHHGVTQGQAAQNRRGPDGNTDRHADHQQNHKSDQEY